MLKGRNLFDGEAGEQVLVMAEPLLQVAHVGHEPQVTHLATPLAHTVVIGKFNLKNWSRLKCNWVVHTVFSFIVLSTL